MTSLNDLVAVGCSCDLMYGHICEIHALARQFESSLLDLLTKHQVTSTTKEAVLAWLKSEKPEK